MTEESSDKVWNKVEVGGEFQFERQQRRWMWDGPLQLFGAEV